jgi:putative selenate reductase
MAKLIPYPFAALVTRAFRELDQQQAVFDLPVGRFFAGLPNRELAVTFQGHAAASPLGPAAGPHTQMAQNLVLSWLGGCRIMELKTVQINDELEIPRPCIDMRTVGFNAEWSQELKLEESLEEYVKGAMLIEMLRASDKLELDECHGSTVYDMSVGYDLAGIRSERVLEFIHGMTDARSHVDRLRRQIPQALEPLRDLDFPTQISDTVTLSTFHGCPPEEIEQIIEFLLTELGLHCVIKFNPMLLGPVEGRRLLNEQLGYHDIQVPDSAFERDTSWDQAVEMMERLGETADRLRLGLGVKFSNTLIVENTQGFLPASEPEVYLSGQPLHVLAMNLVGRFRRIFADRFPISFAAGIDRHNFPDAVALGLVPITVCTDLLKKGGYGRLQGYYAELDRRMAEVGATSVDDFILLAYDNAEEALDGLGLSADDPVGEQLRRALTNGSRPEDAAGDELHARWVAAAKLLNTEHYVASVTRDPRYARDQNSQLPRKIGRHLQLFDCITCDLCVPVCPNDANFTFDLGREEIPIVKLKSQPAGWHWQNEGALSLRERHQIGNFADFCNDCGNCDVFCPEDGGPYVMKPRFFRRAEDWQAPPRLDGFHLERQGEREIVRGRFDGRDYRLEARGGEIIYSGEGFEITYEEDAPEETVAGSGPEEVDLTYGFIMDRLRRKIHDPGQINYLNILPNDGESD